MDLLRELRARRVPHYAVSYCIAGFGLVEFLEFLEGRALLSPHLVNLCALALLLLLPSVVLWAWSQGRPGRDHWGRMEKFAIPGNVVAALVVLLVLFQGKELGAVTETVEVQDENGQVVEREIPKNAFRKRMVLFNFDNDGPENDRWLRHGLVLLVTTELSQDPFVHGVESGAMAAALRTAGYTEGLDLPRALQRKIARDAHHDYFLTGRLAREGEALVVETELHAVKSGRVLARRRYVGTDVFGLVDEISLQVRRDLDLPGHHIDTCPDMPVSEIVTEDLEAYRSFSKAAVRATVFNEWEEATTLLADAVERDPTFALAQYFYSSALQIVGRGEEARTAIDASMTHLYRLPEPVQYQIKAHFYINITQESDKALAVVDMWTQLYPQDLGAWSFKALFHRVRGERPAVIAVLDEMLRIDPQQYDCLREIGALYREAGDFELAEQYLRRYADTFPNDARSWIDLADFYADFGEHIRAREILEKALLIEPGRLGAQLSLADIETHLGDFDAARQLLDHLLADAETPQARSDVLDFRIDFCEIEGRIADAMEEVEAWLPEALQVRPPFEVTLLHAFHVQMQTRTGAVTDALAQIEQLASEAPSPLDRLIRIVRVEPLLVLGRVEEAEAQLSDLSAMVEELKMDVWAPHLNRGWGRLEVARGDYVAAERYFGEAVAAKANSLTNMRLRARALRLLGRLDDAEELLVEVLKVSPSSGDGNLEMARVLADAGATARARQHVQTALKAWRNADADFTPAIAARELLESLSIPQ